MKYRSDEDKCYGVAGMALSLNMLDADDMLDAVNVDADGFASIEFVPDFYFLGNPRLNAKESWQMFYERFKISVGLIIADGMSRKVIRDRGFIDRKQRNHLLHAAREQGKALCGLENDEVDAIFDKYYEHIMRVFSNPGVRKAIGTLAQRLQEQRRFSHAELSDLLQELQVH